MSFISSTPQHCPGFQEFRNMKSFMCQCSHCGASKEIFSDEFDKPHMCPACGEQIDFSACKLEGEARTYEPE